MLGGGNFITENYPTLYPTFSTRKVLTAGDSIENYKEVTPAQKTTIESNVAKLIEAGNGVRTERTPLFEAAGAVFNDKTGYYELNTLTDITESQMGEIYTNGKLTLSGAGIIGKKCRTNFFCSNDLNAFSGGHGYCNLMGVCNGAESIEVFALCKESRTAAFIVYQMSVAFNGAIRLKKIIGAFDFNNQILESARYWFNGCNNLEEVYFRHINQDLYLHTMSKLKAACLEYLIENRINVTSSITIYVHADVMAKLNDETNTQWHQILADAAKKQITFATLT